MTTQPSLMALVGKPKLKDAFEQAVKANIDRIMQDPRQPELAEQMKSIEELSTERSRQNIITLSQFQPYFVLFGATDTKDLDVEVKRSRQRLFEQYVKTVINPQQITIILSDDRKLVVGVHDRILIKLQSADGSDEVARLDGIIISNQKRNRGDDAGRAMDGLATEVAIANDVRNNPEQTAKNFLDSVLVSVIQKKLQEAIDAGHVGFPFEGPSSSGESDHMDDPSDNPDDGGMVELV